MWRSLLLVRPLSAGRIWKKDDLLTAAAAASGRISFFIALSTLFFLYSARTFSVASLNIERQSPLKLHDPRLSVAISQ